MTADDGVTWKLSAVIACDCALARLRFADRRYSLEGSWMFASLLLFSAGRKRIAILLQLLVVACTAIGVNAT